MFAWPLAAMTATTATTAITAIAAADGSRMSVKRLYAPPGDMAAGVVSLPDPSATPTLSKAAVLRADFVAASDGRGSVARVRIAHGGGVLRLLALGRDAARWSVELRLDGRAVPVASEPGLVGRAREVLGSQEIIGFDDPSRGLELEVDPGEVEVVLRAAVEPGTPAVVVLDDDSADALAVHLASRVQRAGGPLELVVQGRAQREFLAPTVDPRQGSARAVRVERAWIRWSDGTREQGVVEARDGSSAILTFARARAGDADVWIDGAVLDGTGAWRARSVLYATRIVDGPRIAGSPVFSPSSSAAGSIGEPAWVACSVPVSDADAGEVVFAATELWAIGSRGVRPIGWIGGLAEVERGGSDAGAMRVRIGVDGAVLRIEPGESLVCRAIRLHEREGFAPLDFVVESIPAVEPGSVQAIAGGPGSDDVPPAWGGVPGVASVPVIERRSSIPPSGAHALVLTHGYCADANTWPLAHFGADAWRYEVPNQNLSNDAFAIDLATRASQFKSYGVVAHSQGGCAALHLYAHYWSGLDWAGPGRLIQTVGTPFEGTALAGNVAALGEIFGVQCGSNYDMTYDGAAAWLSTIPSAARARVYTHTTTFTNHPFQYDYCNILADILLTDPEDGVVEDWSGHIPGAVSMGLKVGWCHVSGMRDPDQTVDSQRNATMNAQGAR